MLEMWVGRLFDDGRQSFMHSRASTLAVDVPLSAETSVPLSPRNLQHLTRDLSVVKDTRSVILSILRTGRRSAKSIEADVNQCTHSSCLPTR